MNAVLDDRTHVTTLAAVSARVCAEARQSFAPTIVALTLQKQVVEVVAHHWSDTHRMTGFISLLPLRGMQRRLGNGLDVRQV